ncbi:hypothetical protein [Moritella sp. F3]|uniref:hypothetical protein n=1 Tax=Moritella sp. F3 TaxID=2718882 RepID=UPI0018E189CA|nr:hypothetical protein [Moritella sp. F3]GIC75610.1 hypothetical protein FMO001_03370 [Moritella sp. F1]GIC80755.1 hypothetical protein FMO003_10360 [Moritella sp. F3]
MSTQKIEPSKVTKPIQLVAAWLVGLILVNGTFLSTAVGIGEPTWLKGTLVIASVINVPIFLGAIFLLQTKFRPQLQEDEYYSQYLDKSTSEYVSISKNEHILSSILDIKSELMSLSELKVEAVFPKENPVVEKRYAWSPHYKIALCDYLPDFYKIQKELKENNIPINKIFGTKNTDNVPKVNHLSFSREVDFNTQVEVLRMLSEYDFDGYAYTVTSEVNPEAIYIGGFGYVNGGYYPFNAELKSLLKTDIEPSDLKYFEKRMGKIKAGNLTVSK